MNFTQFIKRSYFIGSISMVTTFIYWFMKAWQNKINPYMATIYLNFYGEAHLEMFLILMFLIVCICRTIIYLKED